MLQRLHRSAQFRKHSRKHDENGDPYENALAERMNGIIKNEFNLYSSVLNFDDTFQLIVRSVEAYNNVRPHSNCDYQTPSIVHNDGQILKKRWKNYKSKKYKTTIFNEGGSGGSSPQSNPPDPPSKNERHNEENTDLGHKYMVQQNLR